jgi:hypothetical protein
MVAYCLLPQLPLERLLIQHFDRQFLRLGLEANAQKTPKAHTRELTAVCRSSMARVLGSVRCGQAQRKFDSRPTSSSDSITGSTPPVSSLAGSNVDVVARVVHAGVAIKRSMRVKLLSVGPHWRGCWAQCAADKHKGSLIRDEIVIRLHYRIYFTGFQT